MDESSSEEYVSADEGLIGSTEEPAVSPIPEESFDHGATTDVVSSKGGERDPPLEAIPTDSPVVTGPKDLKEPSEIGTVSLPIPLEEDISIPQAKPLAHTSVPQDETQLPAAVSIIPADDAVITPLKEDPQEAKPDTEPKLSSEDCPVPPPRRKRKKKFDKQPSLENLDMPQTEISSFARSMTLGSSDLHKELSRPDARTVALSGASHQPLSARRSDSSGSAGDATPLPLPSTSSTSSSITLGGEIPTSTSSTLGVGVRTRQSPTPPQDTQMPESTSTAFSSLTISTSSDSLTQDQLGRSRSVTPTPAISIEPDLQWTADMLSVPESKVVTSDTSLAKARGSNTTTPSSAPYPSDDDSIDGIADDTPEEGGGADSEGGGADSERVAERKPSPQQGTEKASPTEADNAILESTMVKNLDTGEVIPLSAAEERIPQGHGWSPLSEHLMLRTEAEGGQPGGVYGDEDTPHRRKARKKAFSKIKKWGRKRGGGEEPGTLPYEATLSDGDKFAVKYKQASHKQNKHEFEKVRLKQDLTGIHLGAIWAMEFSICGRLLATAGQDSVVRVWVLATAALFFHELQAQYQHLGVHSSVDSLSEKASVASSSSRSSEEDDTLGGKMPFQDQPLCSYYGHTADVLDLSWSKNFFLLSSSMDKTVRLWHISRKECLCCFQHVDFVTAIAFHPRDDRYFLSGSLDGKLRLWNIPDKRVALWNEIEGVGSHLITAANFCMNGKLAVVGTYDGRCMFYDTEHLKYHTQIHVKSRHGKNKGRKISGVEPLPGEDKLLVTSNDSRIRLYNLKDHELSCKYKGCLNTSSQIKATFSRDGQYIISGSEDNFIYLWKTHLDLSKLSSGRKDRNEFYEAFSSHSAPVTTAVFAPVPGITVDEGIKEVGEMVVAADYQGSIKIYVSGEKL